jgi:hypothetical protein
MTCVLCATGSHCVAWAGQILLPHSLSSWNYKSVPSCPVCSLRTVHTCSPSYSEDSFLTQSLELKSLQHSKISSKNNDDNNYCFCYPRGHLSDTVSTWTLSQWSSIECACLSLVFILLFSSVHFILHIALTFPFWNTGFIFRLLRNFLLFSVSFIYL